MLMMTVGGTRKLSVGLGRGRRAWLLVLCGFASKELFHGVGMMITAESVGE